MKLIYIIGILAYSFFIPGAIGEMIHPGQISNYALAYTGVGFWLLFAFLVAVGLDEYDIKFNSQIKED